MARVRKGRWEDGEFLPMMSATELARPYFLNKGGAGGSRGAALARQRGDEEHARFDREARRHMPRLARGGVR